MHRRALLALPLAAGIASPARAHARLLGAAPAPDSLLAIGPAEVALDFSEALDLRACSIDVRSADDIRVDRGDVRLSGNGRRLAVGMTPLAPGIFTVTWKVMSADTHPGEGRYRFTVTG